MSHTVHHYKLTASAIAWAAMMLLSAVSTALSNDAKVANSNDAARLVEQLSNDDINWDHRNFSTVMPRIEGKTAKSIFALGPKSKPALLKAMDDPKKFAAAHVLLSSIHKSNFPVVQSIFTSDSLIAFYNHMRIDFRATSIDFHPKQRTVLKRFWKREIDGS